MCSREQTEGCVGGREAGLGDGVWKQEGARAGWGGNAGPGWERAWEQAGYRGWVGRKVQV